MVFGILPGIRLYLMLLCPLALTRINPPLAASDYRWFNWSRSEFIRLGLLPLGVLFIAAVMSPFITIFHLPHRTSVILHDVNHAAGIMAMVTIQAVILVPVFEEFFWRGYVQSILNKTFGSSIGIFGQAVLFALAHIGAEPILGLVHTFLIGLLFGIWRHRRNTLLPLILAHMINNALYAAINWW